MFYYPAKIYCNRVNALSTAFHTTTFDIVSTKKFAELGEIC